MVSLVHQWLRLLPRSIVAVILGLSVATPPSRAAAAALGFNRDIRPILSDHCFNCHGQDEKTRKGGLRLDELAAALKGGKSGEPALVPGRPEQSELFLRASATDELDQMPPADSHRARVSATDLAKLRSWIEAGAVYEKHWAFLPPQADPIAVAPAGRPELPLDRIVSARLAREGLQLSPQADQPTLARRLYLDVIGLPPSPKEIAAFSQEGYSATVEKLLRNPAYGEKWARVWLDAARYSDSNGYEKDLPREQWAWRDWVINAYNSDLPYDRFIVEQVAGDLLPTATQDQVVATGFLRNSMINEEGAILPEQFRMEELFDRMDCVGKSVLGLTLQCARCHTHKFDPISHDEYFGLFAFLNDTYEARSWVYTPTQQEQLAAMERTIHSLEDQIRTKRPRWRDELAAWEESIRRDQLPWTTLIATELGSDVGLNHPVQQPDGSILALGHLTTKGHIYAVSEQNLQDVTGLRLEALTHGDLPFGGPGRSRYGTWAISELEAFVQTPYTTEWQKLRLRSATADFSEPEGKLEPEWDAIFDKDKKRTRGPVAFLVDGNKETGWRADRGLGRRNQESAAVVQFECPLDYPAGTKLKITITTDHGGSEHNNTTHMLGCLRLSLTKAPDPQAPPINHAAVLAASVPPSERTAMQQQALFTAWRATLPEAKTVNEAIAAAWANHPQAPTSILHLAERRHDQHRETRLLDRGDWDRLRQVITPQTPAALHPFPAEAPRNRLGFARWLVDPKSPLAARVAVNRVWQNLFGQGLVETPEDFGTRAPLPVQGELLDWLATEFIRHGWSQKHLLRTILASATYRQVSHATSTMLERDPRNIMLARGPRFRLDAEVLRDNALQIAGLLHERVGGPSIFPPVPQSVIEYNHTKPSYWIPAEAPERYRRALYVFRKRSMPDPALNAFDAPNGDTSCVRRLRSNTPLAALTSLNETIFVEAAQALALRILREGGATDAQRADFAYRLCTARQIRPQERLPLERLIRETRTRLAEGWLNAKEIATGRLTEMPALPPGANPQDAAVWTVVARILLNLDDTVSKS
jgi:hypothetical protein